MKVGDSVRLALRDFEAGEAESAMLHACNAIDGTAGKLHVGLPQGKRFKTVLRDNYRIIGPIGMPGVDLVGTRFDAPVKSAAAPGGNGADLADVVYGIHRCTQGHGDELPEGYELIPNAAGPAMISTFMASAGKVALSDRVIFALLWVAVLSPANADQTVPEGYWLSFEDKQFDINAWWGRATDFELVLATGRALPSMTFDLKNWPKT